MTEDQPSKDSEEPTLAELEWAKAYLTDPSNRTPFKPGQGEPVVAVHLPKEGGEISREQLQRYGTAVIRVLDNEAQVEYNGVRSKSTGGPIITLSDEQIAKMDEALGGRGR